MKKYLLVVPALFVLLACGHSGNNGAATAPAVKDTTNLVQESNGVLPGLKDLSYAYAKDPSCGMPLKAGLMDTTTYKGKLYGFCSKECKDEFMKDPAGYTAKIK